LAAVVAAHVSTARTDNAGTIDRLPIISASPLGIESREA